MPSSPGQRQIVAADTARLEALSTHTTCPPEEARQPLSIASEDDERPAGGDESQQSSHQIDKESDQESEDNETRTKRLRDIDEAVMRDTPSPVITQEERGSDHDSRLARSMSATALSPRPQTTWPALAESSDRIVPNSTSSFLRPGSRFVGTQQSDRQRYTVQVEIKYVDMEESFLCGYLKIQGLTDDHPTLTTYFEGEIIGNRHTFKTAHPEWGSSEKVDMQHWARFPAWRPLAKQAKSPVFTYKNYAQREHIFMRWKEYFLVSDHKVKTINGASFEGFYYICFNQCTGGITGIYFHAKSEKYQQLDLEHVKDSGCTTAIEFR